MAVSRGKLAELFEAELKRPQLVRRKDYTYDAIEMFSGISLAEYKPKAAQMIGSHEDDLCKTSFKEMNVQVLVACVGKFIDEHMVRMEKTEKLLMGVLRLFVLISKHKGHNIEQQKKKTAAVAAMASSGGCGVLVPSSQDEQVEKRKPGRPKKLSTLTQVLPTPVNSQIRETHGAPHALQPATDKRETEQTVTLPTTQYKVFSHVGIGLSPVSPVPLRQGGNLPQPPAAQLSELQALIPAAERYDHAQKTIKFLEDERAEILEDLKSANTQVADSRKHSVQLAAECGRLQAVEKLNTALMQKVTDLEKTNADLRTQCSQYLDLYKDSNRKRKRADSRANKERHKRLMQTMRFGDLLEGCKTVFDEHKEMILHGSESDSDEFEAGENGMDGTGTEIGRGRPGEGVAGERQEVDDRAATFEAANHHSETSDSVTNSGVDDRIRAELEEAEKQGRIKCGTAALGVSYTPPHTVKDNEHTIPRSLTHNSNISTSTNRQTAVTDIVARNVKEDGRTRMRYDAKTSDDEDEQKIHEDGDKNGVNGKKEVTEINGNMDTED